MGGPAPPAVAYVYADGRSMADLASQVQGFTGILQVDGYGSYKGLARRHPQIQLAFCLAHARRKFVAVYKATHAPLARDVIAALRESMRKCGALTRLWRGGHRPDCRWLTPDTSV